MKHILWIGVFLAIGCGTVTAPKQADKYTSPVTDTTECRIWDEDFPARVAQAVTDTVSSDAVLARYGSFWEANTARFANQVTNGVGIYQWSGNAWQRTGADNTVRFLFEDGTTLVVEPFKLTHADGWVFTYDDLAEQFNLADSWTLTATDVGAVNPPTSVRTPISEHFDMTNEPDYIQTYRITLEGATFEAAWKNDAITLTYNERRNDYTAAEFQKFCPGVWAEISTFFPDARQFVSLSGPHRVREVVWPYF